MDANWIVVDGQMEFPRDSHCFLSVLSLRVCFDDGWSDDLDALCKWDTILSIPQS